MSEILVPPEGITSEMVEYGKAAKEFILANGLPEEFFADADHLMIKSSNASEFDQQVKSIAPWSEQLAFVEIDYRFLVAAQLLTPLIFADHRPIEWIEIMEPKSTEGTVDYFGVEYAEFYYENFNKAGMAMRRRKVPFEKRTDGMHRWWNVRLDDEGREIRITDKPLSEIIGQELEDGTARYLDMAA